MKAGNLLSATLALNLCLGATAAYLLIKYRAESENSPGGSVAAISPTNRPVLNIVKTRTLFTPGPREAFSWRLVESPDYKVYIENLRAIGCPEETIRDIISYDVNKLYGEKERALRSVDGMRQYWKSPRPGSREELEIQKKYRALEKEKSALLVALLGVDPFREDRKQMGFLDYWERMYSFLPQEKQERAREIQEKYQDLQQEIWQRNAGGAIDEDDQKEMQRLVKSQMAEMSKFLTPRELEDYEVRSSQVANQLRYDLEGFEPTEAEFRDIFRIKKGREEDLASTSFDPDDKAANDRRQKATQETDKQVKEVLGEERYREYERGKAWEYRELARLTDRQGLPKEAAINVYDMKKTVEEQASKLRNDKSLTAEQRDRALAAMRDETEKSVGEILGDTAYKKYKTRGGWWISNLAPGK